MKQYKKEEGSVAIVDMIPLILTVVVVGLLGILFTSWTVNFNRKNEIDIIAREYLLRMESNGYLTDSDVIELNNDLKDAHMTDIDISGTTITEVQNGDTIVVSIKGKLELLSFKILDIFSTEEDLEQKDISITKKSTAKNKR